MNKEQLKLLELLRRRDAIYVALYHYLFKCQAQSASEYDEQLIIAQLFLDHLNNKILHDTDHYKLEKFELISKLARYEFSIRESMKMTVDSIYIDIEELTIEELKERLNNMLPA